MKSIEINIIQFLLLIIFIYTFTFFWLPKINISETEEYLVIKDALQSVLNEKNHWHNSYNKLVNYYNANCVNPQKVVNTVPVTYESQIGSKNSSHSGAITPRNILSNDNDAIFDLLY
jgi:hypothetical protein